MVWLPVFGIFNMCTNVDGCDCTQGCTDTVRVCTGLKLTGRKIPCHPGNLTPCQYSAWLSVRCSTNWAITAPCRGHQHWQVTYTTGWQDWKSCPALHILPSCSCLLSQGKCDNKSWRPVRYAREQGTIITWRQKWWCWRLGEVCSVLHCFGSLMCSFFWCALSLRLRQQPSIHFSDGTTAGALLCHWGLGNSWAWSLSGASLFNLKKNVGRINEYLTWPRAC